MLLKTKNFYKCHVHMYKYIDEPPVFSPGDCWGDCGGGLDDCRGGGR